MVVKKFFTAESVNPGHPDKIADQISDAVLDEVMKQDKYGRVACEVFVGMGYVVVGGEITTHAWVDFNNLARQVVVDIGYDKPSYGFDGNTLAVLDTVHAQSADIAKGVKKTGTKEQGAGDQGISIGYATNETKEFLPLEVALANKLSMRLVEVRQKKILPYLRPDGKSQVTVEYHNDVPKRLDSAVIACQHDPNISLEKIKKDVIRTVITPVCKKFLDKETRYYVNNTGRFVIGGPVADTGLTGRKNVVDAYGPGVPIGGGAFSGKDPTKVDRSGAYMARYIAKNVVASGLAKKCKIEIAYVIGGTKPTAVYVDTYGTGRISDRKLEEIIPKIFDLSPGGIIRQLNLLRPIYRKTAAFGHFGRNEKDFTWEKTDKIEEIKKYASELSKV